MDVHSELLRKIASQRTLRERKRYHPIFWNNETTKIYLHSSFMLLQCAWSENISDDVTKPRLLLDGANSAKIDRKMDIQWL